MDTLLLPVFHNPFKFSNGNDMIASADPVCFEWLLIPKGNFV